MNIQDKIRNYLKEEVDNNRVDEASFTRKHYNKIAALLKEYKVEDGLINEFADMFEKDNPNFKRDFFIKACK